MAKKRGRQGAKLGTSSPTTHDPNRGNPKHGVPGWMTALPDSRGGQTGGERKGKTVSQRERDRLRAEATAQGKGRQSRRRNGGKTGRNRGQK